MNIINFLVTKMVTLWGSIRVMVSIFHIKKCISLSLKVAGSSSVYGILNKLMLELRSQ